MAFGQERASSGLSAPQQIANLQEQAIRKLVASTLGSEDFDPAVLDDPVKYVYGFQISLRQELVRNADKVGLSSASIMLLVCAYANEDILDLSFFRNLRAEHLKIALSRGELSKVNTINVSGIEATKSPAELWDALSILKHLKCIYILDRPDRENDDAGTQIFLALAASHADLNIDKLVISSQFSRAIKLSSWLPDMKTSSTSLAAFPVVQLLVWHNNCIYHEQPYFFEVFAIADALLSPVRVVTGLFQYLGTQTGLGIQRFWGTGVTGAHSFAIGSSSLGGNRSLEISALPPELYRNSINAYHSYHSSMYQGCYSMTQDLLPGQWTILVTQGFKVPAERAHRRVASLGYAFIQSKIAISTTPTEDGRTEIKPEDLEIVDFAGFLQKTAPHVDCSQLQYHFDALQEAAFKMHNMKVPETGVLTFLEATDVCKLLDRFIDNVSAMNDDWKRTRSQGH